MTTNKKEYRKKYYQEHKEVTRQQTKIWREANKERTKKYSKDYFERNKDKIKRDRKYNKITTGGKGIWGIKKRIYDSNECELCSGITKRNGNALEYHHWDDTDLQKGKEVKGIWICHKCHQFITLMENYPQLPELYKKYLEIKNNYAKWQK